jgi:hypothetical protein
MVLKGMKTTIDALSARDNFKADTHFLPKFQSGKDRFLAYAHPITLLLLQPNYPYKLREGTLVRN